MGPQSFRKNQFRRNPLKTEKKSCTLCTTSGLLPSGSTHVLCNKYRLFVLDFFSQHCWRENLWANRNEEETQKASRSSCKTSRNLIACHARFRTVSVECYLPPWTRTKVRESRPAMIRALEFGAVAAACGPNNRIRHVSEFCTASIQLSPILLWVL